MKQILIVALVLFLFTAGGLADDTPKPFTEMTLEELRAVDTSALSRDARKHYKKALRAAKKAEKARIKAEKARIRAEKKRQRAIERAQRKKARKLSRRQNRINGYYAKTEIYGSDFEKYIRVVGPSKFRWGDLHYSATYFLRAFHYPGEKRTTLQVYVTTRYMLERELVGHHPDNHKYWRQYYAANMRGGDQAEVHQTERHLDKCDESHCWYEEDIAITIPPTPMLETIPRFQSFDLKIKSRSGHSYILDVTNMYIIGYMLRLIELDSDMGKARAVLTQARDSLPEDGFLTFDNPEASHAPRQMN